MKTQNEKQKNLHWAKILLFAYFPIAIFVIVILFLGLLQSQNSLGMLICVVGESIIVYWFLDIIYDFKKGWLMFGFCITYISLIFLIIYLTFATFNPQYKLPELKFNFNWFHKQPVEVVVQGKVYSEEEFIKEIAENADAGIILLLH